MERNIDELKAASACLTSYCRCTGDWEKEANRILSVGNTTIKRIDKELDWHEEPKKVSNTDINRLSFLNSIINIFNVMEKDKHTSTEELYLINYSYFEFEQWGTDSGYHKNMVRLFKVFNSKNEEILWHSSHVGYNWSGKTSNYNNSDSESYENNNMDEYIDEVDALIYFMSLGNKYQYIRLFWNLISNKVKELHKVVTEEDVIKHIKELLIECNELSAEKDYTNDELIDTFKELSEPRKYEYSKKTMK